MREVLAIVREAKARAIVLTVDLIPDGRTAPPPPPPAFWEIHAPEASFNGLYSGASIDDLAWLCAERSEEHTSELQSLMRISYAVFCLKKKKKKRINIMNTHLRNLD